MEQSTAVYNRLNEYQLFQEWTGTCTSYKDGLLYGLAVCLALWPHMLYGSVFGAGAAAPGMFTYTAVRYCSITFF